jgi:hypothetical protein
LVGSGFLGTIGAVVEVDGGNGVDVRVIDELASFVRGVKVGTKVCVGLGVRVTDGVAVGMMGVRVGVSEAVGVGAVEVGKGPRSDPVVSARAVLVLFAICFASASGGERLNTTT